MLQIGSKGMQELARVGGKGHLPGIVQEIEIWRCLRLVNQNLSYKMR